MPRNWWSESGGLMSLCPAYDRRPWMPVRTVVNRALCKRFEIEKLKKKEITITVTRKKTETKKEP